MIRRLDPDDLAAILAVVIDGAEAYRGIIPPDRWHEPYMPEDALRQELAAGVEFWGQEVDGELVGVMGVQPVRDVTLIRHAYVRTAWQRKGFGGALLQHLLALTSTPVMIGTWAAAEWAVRFYERHGFRLVSPDEKERLLTTYWTVPARQRETSVVLADRRWFARTGG
ncbi:MAG: GNAT family N-acetyltransferase [Chloroflexota bacterium]|nr:MAG: GNAT family N-acetyltransferase [Chloroflexota bacterium]